VLPRWQKGSGFEEGLEPTTHALRASEFILHSHEGVSWLEAPNLIAFPWIVHAFGTRARGSLTPSNTAEHTPAGVASRSESKQAFLRHFHPGEFQAASVHQVHSSEVIRVTRRREPLEYNALRLGIEIPVEGKPSADALITDEAGVLLTVRTADCLPVLIAAPRRRALAAVHAGWRGALKGVVGNTVREMQRQFACEPRNLVAALGPSIRSCCYVVGQDVVDAFSKQFRGAEKFFRSAANHRAAPPVLPSNDDHPPSSSPLHLDLVAVALEQLAETGVPFSHIQVSDLCTFCRADLFYSYRKEGAATGRMLAAIGMYEGRASGE
jgi:YfiH family protein